MTQKSTWICRRSGTSIQKPKAKPLRVIIGDWDENTIRVDFDNATLAEVKYWGYRAWYWFKLGGFIILESSRKTLVAKIDRTHYYEYVKRSYHLVFDVFVRWETNAKVMGWIALESKHPEVLRYFTMQLIKENSTLRIGKKGSKSPPKIVFKHGSQDRQIAKFLENRKVASKLIKNLEVVKTDAA